MALYCVACVAVGIVFGGVLAANSWKQYVNSLNAAHIVELAELNEAHADALEKQVGSAKFASFVNGKNNAINLARNQISKYQEKAFYFLNQKSYEKLGLLLSVPPMQVMYPGEIDRLAQKDLNNWTVW